MRITRNEYAVQSRTGNLCCLVAVVFPWIASGGPSLLESLHAQAVGPLSTLHSWRPKIVFRELAVVDQGAVGVSHVYDGGDTLTHCALLDVYVSLRGKGADAARAAAGRLFNLASLRSGLYGACNARFFWAKGRGADVDWLPGEADALCGMYDALFLEDEFVIDQFKSSPKSSLCQIRPLDPYHWPPSQPLQLPFAPGRPLPPIERALVSFHAYRVYDEAAQHNPQRWLEDPDHWNPYFMALVKGGFLKICLDPKDCQGDDRPFRLMFWEEVDDEFVECLSRGITPIYMGTVPIYKYSERNTLLLPYRFEDPEEMSFHVQTLSSPQGLVEHGVRVYMHHASNHLLATLYWAQDVNLRAALMVSTLYRRRAQDASVLGELLVSVTSTPGNLHLRNIIRQTWGREKQIWGGVRIRVLFFVGDSPEVRTEQTNFQDLVILPHVKEEFKSIWLKTVAILKFGSDFFTGRLRQRGGDTNSAVTPPPVRFLVKCDDDAFLDIDAIAEDLFGLDANLAVGMYWGHLMALVEPSRDQTDKYYVPTNAYAGMYYPTYARGMAYALSEDLVIPLGEALHAGAIDPFPYREDVSVGLYLLALAKQGKVRVVPKNRKAFMPIDISQHCLEAGTAPGPLIVLHRFHPDHASCFWDILTKQRVRQRDGGYKEERHAAPANFCNCVSRR